MIHFGAGLSIRLSPTPTPLPPRKKREMSSRPGLLQNKRIYRSGGANKT